jgi:hypothetical protein
MLNLGARWGWVVKATPLPFYPRESCGTRCVCNLIGSSRSLSYDRSIASSQASASFFNLQYPLVSLRSSSSCLRLLPRLPVTSILPSVLPTITCFLEGSSRARYDQSSYPSFVLLYVGYSSPALYLIPLSLFLERDCPGKVIMWRVFRLLSSLQYISRSNRSGHACCYTMVGLQPPARQVVLCGPQPYLLIVYILLKITQ